MSDQWPFFATIAGGVLAWFVTLERRLNSKLSLKEHVEICERAQRENMEMLREIKGLVTENEVAVRSLTTQVAVLAVKLEASRGSA
jgi:phosphohistidine swiveling domain-containing protein